MRVKIQAAAWAVAAAVSFGVAVLSAAPATLTGTVSDAMCGVKHGAKDPAACTRGCVKEGSDYALVVKDKVFTLKANDAAKAELNKLAGQLAKVTGEQNGDTIEVASVQAAK